MVVTKSNPRSVPVPGSVLKGWRLLALRLTQKPPGAGTVLVGCQCRVIRTGSFLAVCLILEQSFSCCSNTVLPPKFTLLVVKLWKQSDPSADDLDPSSPILRPGILHIQCGFQEGFIAVENSAVMINVFY